MPWMNARRIQCLCGKSNVWKLFSVFFCSFLFFVFFFSLDINSNNSFRLIAKDLVTCYKMISVWSVCWPNTMHTIDRRKEKKVKPFEFDLNALNSVTNEFSCDTFSLILTGAMLYYYHSHETFTPTKHTHIRPSLCQFPSETSNIFRSCSRLLNFDLIHFHLNIRINLLWKTKSLANVSSFINLKLFFSFLSFLLAE